MKTTHNPERLALTVSQAAEMIGIGRTKLYDEIRSNRLRTFRIGRRRLVTVAAIRDWVERAEIEEQT